MRHLLNVVVAAIASLLVVIGWKPILGLETFHVDIKITALGTKDPQSASAEVWMHLDGWPEGVTIDDFLSTASPAEGWEKRGEAAVSYQYQPASVSWKGVVGPEAKLAFTRHDWSGNVRLAINGSARTYDLYNATAGAPELVVPLKQVPAVFRDSLLSLPRTILPAAVITLLLLVLFRHHAARRALAKR